MMKWTVEAVRDFAHAYFNDVSWAPKAVEKDGEIPYWDIDAVFDYKDEVLEHLDLMDSEAKRYLKEEDEIVLSNIDIFLESGGKLLVK